jgi:2-polyprenyl-6-methoxyphenol hydroxylase-like FAD-dependent oxidoreductase
VGELTNVEVLVVGSGGSGLVAAVNLVQAGISCRVIEKNDAPFPGSRGKTLTPRAMEMLDNLNVFDAIRAQADWYEGEETAYTPVIAGGEVVGMLYAAGTPTPNTPYMATMFVPQWHTEAVLRDELASYGVKVEWSTELLELAQDDSGVTASLSLPDGRIETIRAAYLVGGDGAASTVRKALGVSFVGGVIPSSNWLIGDVQIDGLECPEPTTGAHMYCWTAPDGTLWVRRFKNSVRWQFEAQIEPDGHGNLPPATLETMQQLVERRTGRTDLHLHDLSSWVAHHRVNIRCAERFQVGRVLLAGEAAHVQMAGGLCTAILDSSNLAWKMAAALRGGPAWLLDTYDIERGLSARHEVERTRRLYESAGLNYQGEGRRELDPQQVIAGFNDPQHRAEMTQLQIRYRDSPLSLTLGDQQMDVCAGDRAPDAPCQDAAGSRVIRLFDLCRGPHWTLLGFGADGAEVVRRVAIPDALEVKVHAVLREHVVPADEDAVIDTGGHAHDGFAVGDNAVVLVRPDNYIGLIGRPADPAALDAYLARLGGST